MSVASFAFAAMDEVSEDPLIDWLMSEGVRIEEVMTPKGYWGAYSHHERNIYLRRALPSHYRLPTLLHETQHYLREDEGHQAARVECGIDEYVAALLINEADYRFAESQIGPSIAGLAVELEVPKWVIRAYRRTLVRVG